MQSIYMNTHSEISFCLPHRLAKLIEYGYKTNGSDVELQTIITSAGFGLPGFENGYFAFMINYHYIRVLLTYVDALAEEIILLHELNMIKPK